MKNKKFNPELPCNNMPFAYLEKKTKVNIGEEQIAIISFGALEIFNRYAPEYGGVAVVHESPDVFIGVKYIPWDMNGRSFEHDLLIENINKISNLQELTDFLFDDGYIIPAVKEKIGQDYLQKVEEWKNKTEKSEEKGIDSYKGEEIIPFDN